MEAYTIKVERNGVTVFRHFDTRAQASQAARQEIDRGHTVLAIFFPEEAWA